VIAVVAGATRGAGRGIACALGELGATVYCTGRSTRAERPARRRRRGPASPFDLARRPETIGFAMAEELRAHRVAAVAVTPGFLRSEAMLEHFGVTEATWRDGVRQDPHFAFSESPLFVGRGIAALARDRRVLAKSGRVLSSWRLAREYRFTDADGSRPDWGKHTTDPRLDAETRALFAAQRESHDRFVQGFTPTRRRP